MNQNGAVEIDEAGKFESIGTESVGMRREMTTRTVERKRNLQKK